jgi:hypothetical protein
MSKQTKTGEVTEVDIRDMFQQIMKGQEQTRRSLESRFDKLRNELKTEIDLKIKNLKDEVEMKFSKLEDDVKQFGFRLGLLEEAHSGCSTWDSEQKGIDRNLTIASGSRLSFDTTTTVIVSGLKEELNENLSDKIQDLVKAMEVDTVNIVRCIRLESKVRNKPGLVKIEVENEMQKVDILKSKRRLQEYPAFNKVFIRGSKSYSERMMERNTRMLLKSIPDGDKYRLTSNGKLVLKEEIPGKKGYSRQVKNPNHVDDIHEVQEINMGMDTNRSNEDNLNE